MIRTAHRCRSGREPAGTQAPVSRLASPLPGLGIFERINIGALLLWVALLSILLPRARPPGNRTAIDLRWG